MPAVVAVLNSKGGSGKTMLATSLARGFQQGKAAQEVRTLTEETLELLNGAA